MLPLLPLLSSSCPAVALICCWYQIVLRKDHHHPQPLPLPPSQRQLPQFTAGRALCRCCACHTCVPDAALSAGLRLNWCLRFCYVCHTGVSGAALSALTGVSGASLSAIQAFQVLHELGASGAAVVDSRGSLAGNLSVSDLRCLAPGLFAALLLPVKDFLTNRPLLMEVQLETSSEVRCCF